MIGIAIRIFAIGILSLGIWLVFDLIDGAN